jgi:hypothetical protein
LTNDGIILRNHPPYYPEHQEVKLWENESGQLLVISGK